MAHLQLGVCARPGGFPLLARLMLAAKLAAPAIVALPFGGALVA
jgi:hypothetical protein